MVKCGLWKPWPYPNHHSRKPKRSLGTKDEWLAKGVVSLPPMTPTQLNCCLHERDLNSHIEVTVCATDIFSSYCTQYYILPLLLFDIVDCYRESMKHIWDQAVKFLSAKDSRVRVESQRIAGEDFEVWRLLHHSSPSSKKSSAVRERKLFLTNLFRYQHACENKNWNRTGMIKKSL